MAELLSSVDWPEGFSYPAKFIRIVELGLTNLDPWLILEGDLLRRRVEGMRKRYPGRRVVPVAMRGDNDDVACFDADLPGKVVIIHDFASPGYEDREVFDNFADWFRKAVEDMLEFE